MSLTAAEGWRRLEKQKKIHENQWKTNEILFEKAMKIKEKP